MAQPAVGATVVVPEWMVSTNGTTGGDIPAGGTDTLVRLANPSAGNVLAKFELWSRTGVAVLGFMVPLRGGDVINFSMKDILNGTLNLNPATQSVQNADACFSSSWYRFPNPSAWDRDGSISIYATPAYSGSFRRSVWDWLDDSPRDGVFTGMFRGRLTIDVVNYCTLYNPTSSDYFTLDAIATVWPAGATSNVLTGSAEYQDPMGTWEAITHVLAFDPTLDWDVSPTYYSPYNISEDWGVALPGVPVDFAFRGDGRQLPGPVPCTFYLAPASTTTGSGAGSSSVAVVGAPTGCSGDWSAVADAPWLSVTPSSGSGSAQVTVSWTANAAAARTGTVTIGGQLHTVSQAASPNYQFSLVVGRLGNGTGLVSSSPLGISCGSTCNASFTAGSLVTLTASPAAGSRFAGWAGGGCAGTGTCTVTMDAAKTVTATFLPTTASRFYAVTPCRVVDTRNPAGPLGGPALAAAATRTFALGGACNVPADATAVSLNVTVADATAPGSLTIYPGTGPAPGTNTITFVPGKNRANNVTMGLIGGALSVVDYQATGTVNLIIDVNGYYR